MIVKNITLLGHKDHGKSTLIGNLLIQTKSVTEARINDAKKISKQFGRQFEPGYILDSFSEEREREMTIDTTRAEMVYKDLAFAFIDVPGHEELIKNMISGASYAEIALLLVSAKKDEGIMDQTKRHIFIARMLGIKKLIVAVNKMDLIDYNKEIFDGIAKELKSFIEKVGFEGSKVYFVPISAYNADNLIKKSQKMKWYKGATLVELLYKHAKEEGTNMDGMPMRILAQGVIDLEHQTVVGKVISGKIAVGERIKVLPVGSMSTVKTITVKGKRAKSAKTDDDVALKLDKKVGDDIRGSVICTANSKQQLSGSLKSLIFVTGPIGTTAKIRFNGVNVNCKKITMLKNINTATGNAIKSKIVAPLNAMEAKIELEKKIPIEKFDDVKELGRFVLYDKLAFVGIGIVI
ncbi:MAG: GTP-binding protein [Candidatus Micrarchaeales archaeon]